MSFFFLFTFYCFVQAYTLFLKVYNTNNDCPSFFAGFTKSFIRQKVYHNFLPTSCSVVFSPPNACKVPTNLFLPKQRAFFFVTKSYPCDLVRFETKVQLNNAVLQNLRSLFFSLCVGVESCLHELGFQGVRGVVNPLVPSGPFGCRSTTTRGALSSVKLLSRLIRRSGRCLSLKHQQSYYCNCSVHII